MFAALADVKDFLGLTHIDQFDNKLQIILAGVNDSIQDYVGTEKPDDRLKLAACMWIDAIWAGEVTDSDMPVAVKRILDRYVDPWDNLQGVEVELI